MKTKLLPKDLTDWLKTKCGPIGGDEKVWIKIDLKNGKLAWYHKYNPFVYRFEA